jgi:hypothetical protein
MMRTSVESIRRPLRRGLGTLVLGIAVLWAMTSNAHAQIYVSQENLDSVSEYNATTGATINVSCITGLIFPQALAAASVPEPSTWSMIAVGSVALLGIMLRKTHHIAWAQRYTGLEIPGGVCG